MPSAEKGIDDSLFLQALNHSPMPCESLNGSSIRSLKFAVTWRADVAILVGELFVSGDLENSSEAEEESELDSVPKNPMLNKQPCQAPRSLPLARRQAV